MGTVLAVPLKLTLLMNGFVLPNVENLGINFCIH